MIYLDNAATTKPYLEALEEFNRVNKNFFFNPSAPYSCAFDLFKQINDARKIFVDLLGGNREQDQIVFTSGATESNNLAIFGSATNKKKKYLFSMGEHPSVFNCANELRAKGFDVDFIPLSQNGQIDYEKFNQMCDESVGFVSIMLVSNETGSINDLARIRKILDTKCPNAILHVDAVQGFCKIDFNVNKYKVNLVSISAHKIGGIKGIGALYISSATKLKNINYGGGQEFTLRSGTVNAGAIFSFLKSAQITFANKKVNYDKMLQLKNYVVKELANVRGIKLVSDNDCSPYIISIILDGNRGETIMRKLDMVNNSYQKLTLSL